VPTISSFSPASGNIGTTVTITGTNFNATPTNNVVFFGATRATVTAATATSVTVTVPTSATYAPITLLNMGTSLAAYSLSNFTPTYSPIKTTITATDFQTKQDFATGTNPFSVAIGDLDGDGKPDLAVANNGSNTVSVYRNTSTSGSIGTGSFAAKVDFATGGLPYSVAIGDLDGDGKPDLSVANFVSNNVSVIRNKSTIGSIDFYAKVDFATDTFPGSVAIGDLDGDGKPDLAIANQRGTVSVMRNNSTSGSIGFYAKVDFATGRLPYSVAIGDLDGDGKPDLAVSNSFLNIVSVFRNKSTSRSIDFYAKVDFATGKQPRPVAIGDLDGDGKPDLAVSNIDSRTVSVILNKSTSGTIDFDAKVDFAPGTSPISVAMGDLDGDGKPDLAVANQGSNNVSVIRNKSTSGSISFDAKEDFATGGSPYSVAIGDLDGDGRPDLVVANFVSSTISVLRNASLSDAPIITPPASLSVCSPSTLTLTASGCAGTVTWSEGAATGTSLTLSAVGTYSITATCTVAGITSAASTAVTGLEIKAKPNAPSITPPASLSVFTPSTLTLTASGCAGTVTWSEGAATGTSLTLSRLGTYSVSATCTLNGCVSDPSTAITGLQIKEKPDAPTLNAPTEKVVCFPNTLTLSALGCAGTVTWSQGSATGTSLTLSTVDTYSITATCTVNGSVSDPNTAVTGLEIKVKPNAPTVTAPTEKVVCFPSTLTLTSSGCAGTVTWSQGSATGTSLTLSTVGTYSITATCTVNGCISDPSTAVTGLEIKAKPNAPTVNAPTEKVVCFPSTLTLTASGCAGTVTWSQGSATGTSLTLSTVGTYSITATCTVNGCTSDASTAVTGLEIKAQPIISSSNTGPYTVGQTISLNGTGIGTYNWTGPNNFTSTLSNPTINNALSVNAGVYTLSVTGLNSCINTSTTNVVVNEIDPCDPTRVVDYFYVKAGNPYQPLFQLKDGMVINQTRDQVSILANPVCSSVIIESMEMNIQGPELNWNTLQNAEPNALFDNAGLNFWGRNFNPGNYTLTVTGFARDNKGGGITYGPKIIRFTVVGSLATINAPTLSKTSICAGSSVDVSFATSGTFNDINQFQVELSDSSGSFEKPVLIGTANTTGTITCLIPQNTLEGTRYLVRVKSSNQVVVSNPVISQVTVNPLNYSLVSPTNNLTGTSTKKAVDSINASNKISSPANVVYQAGKSVLLTPGFESSAVFRAEVKSCDN
jgi:hypothetical protein